jgi:hypothetical protein
LLHVLRFLCSFLALTLAIVLFVFAKSRAANVAAATFHGVSGVTVPDVGLNLTLSHDT